jgi:hypothetical protein
VPHQIHWIFFSSSFSYFLYPSSHNYSKLFITHKNWCKLELGWREVRWGRKFIACIHLHINHTKTYHHHHLLWIEIKRVQYCVHA